jgi:glucokinase
MKGNVSLRLIVSTIVFLISGIVPQITGELKHYRFDA